MSRKDSQKNIKKLLIFYLFLQIVIIKDGFQLNGKTKNDPCFFK